MASSVVPQVKTGTHSQHHNVLSFETLIIISHDDDKSYADIDDNDEDVEDGDDQT